MSYSTCNRSRLVKRSSNFRTSIYKFEFEFSLEAFAIRFVAADSGVDLTSGAVNGTASASVDNDLDSATDGVGELKCGCVITSL